MTLPAEDVKQLRKLAADRDYQKARADEAIKQRDDWQSSSAKWQTLYLSEKSRADGVQEERIKEIKSANTATKGANSEYKVQADKDAAKISSLTAENIRLRSSRKWYVAVGTVIGAVAGSYVAWKLSNKAVIVPGFGPQPANQLKFSLQF